MQHEYQMVEKGDILHWKIITGMYQMKSSFYQATLAKLIHIYLEAFYKLICGDNLEVLLL